MKKAFLIVAVVIFNYACSAERDIDQPVVDHKSVKAEKVFDEYTLTYKSLGMQLPTYQADIYNDKEKLERVNSQPALAEIQKLVLNFKIEERTDWQNLDGALRTIINDNESNPDVFILRQIAASEMLVGHGIELFQYNSSNQEAMGAISYYTEQLVLGGSGATGLIYFCLKKLENHWSNDKIKEVALKTLEIAKTNGPNNKLKDILKKKAKEEEQEAAIGISEKFVLQEELYMNELLKISRL